MGLVLGIDAIIADEDVENVFARDFSGDPAAANRHADPLFRRLP
jgi:hypothetical protein